MKLIEKARREGYYSGYCDGSNTLVNTKVSTPANYKENSDWEGCKLDYETEFQSAQIPGSTGAGSAEEGCQQGCWVAVFIVKDHNGKVVDVCNNYKSAWKVADGLESGISVDEWPVKIYRWGKPCCV